MPINQADTLPDRFGRPLNTAPRGRKGVIMKERFEGDNRPNLVDALKRQEFVGGDNALAEAMAEQGYLLEFRKGHKIIIQGGEDNDIYLLVSGDVSMKVPAAFALFPKDISQPPREWAERFFNVQRWTEMPRGGHFAAMEEPEFLAEDLRTWFRSFRTNDELQPLADR
jgi:pimeloyl-ACP methyl ester carboxylesterase